MNLTFTANTLCAAERAIGKPLVAILAELESDAGASLTTLRALVAAGRHGAMYASLPAVYLDEFSAGRLLDEHGTTASAEAVGKAFKEYFARSAA